MVHIEKQQFGMLSDGTEIFLYTINNGNMKITITNYGACITGIFLPAKNAHGFDDIILGYSTLDGYIRNEAHFGSLLGRVSGRISNAMCKIDAEEYLLTKNEGAHCVHSGFPAYDRQVWNSTYDSGADNGTVFLERYSYDGEQGFPGSLQILVSYTLTVDNEFVIRAYAKTDAPTFVNLSNHTFFNLNPAGMQQDGSFVSVLNHELLIPSDEYLEMNDELLPTGALLSLEGSAYDFRKPKLLNTVITSESSGFEVSYVSKTTIDSYKALACVLHEPVTGRMLRVYSTQPALTVSTANSLKNHIGKNGNRYEKFSGICLESQNFPDSPNHSNFPSALLLPEQIYNQETVWYFTF